MKKPKSMDYMKYERSMGMDRTPDKIQQLEATNKQLIDALMEAQTWLKTLPKEKFGTYGEDQGTKLWVRDDILHQIKTALRNAGVNEENP